MPILNPLKAWTEPQSGLAAGCWHLQQPGFLFCMIQSSFLSHFIARQALYMPNPWVSCVAFCFRKVCSTTGAYTHVFTHNVVQLNNLESPRSVICTITLVLTIMIDSTGESIRNVASQYVCFHHYSVHGPSNHGALNCSVRLHLW